MNERHPRGEPWDLPGWDLGPTIGLGVIPTPDLLTNDLTKSLHLAVVQASAFYLIG
jgi:hypothetical protein